MKIVNVLTCVAIIVSLGTTPVRSQKLWSLQECIQYALDNNIQIKRQELQKEITKNDYRQSKFQILPDLNAGAAHNWNFGRNVNQFTNEITNTNVMSDNFYATSTITLFSGFQIRNTIQQNRYLMEKSFQDFETARNDISLQVATIFLQILFNEEAIAIAEGQLNVTSLQLQKTGKLVDVGNKARGELLQIQAQEADEKYNLINAKNNLKISYLTLAQLLELPNGDSIRIFRPDSVALNFENVIAPVDAIYREGITKLPQIKSAEYDLKIAEKTLLIARGGRSPKLSLSGSIGTGYTDIMQRTDSVVMGVPVTSDYPFWGQLSVNQRKSVSLNLSIPIFNNMQNSRNIRNAVIRLKDAEFSLEQTKKNLYKEIQKAHADAVAAMERYNSATEAVTYNEESFKYSQQKFDVGMVTSVDYNVAKNNLTQAKSNLIQAKYEYLFKIKVLDFYRGMPMVIQ